MRSEFTVLQLSHDNSSQLVVLLTFPRKDSFSEMDVNQAKQEHLLALKGILSSLQQTDSDFRMLPMLFVEKAVTNANMLFSLTGHNMSFLQ